VSSNLLFTDTYFCYIVRLGFGAPLALLAPAHLCLSGGIPMSALTTFLDNVGDEEKARVEDVGGKRVLYVVVRVFRKHLSTVTNLVHYQSEIDYAILISNGRKTMELWPMSEEE